MRLHGLLVSVPLILVGSCGGQSDRVEASLQAAERVEAAQREQMDRLVAELSVLLSDFERTNQMLQDAERNFATATRSWGQASAEYTAAATSYSEAAQRWKMVTTALVVAASYDIAAGKVCPNVESTHSYRRKLGIVGDKSLCVDHLWPHAKSGVNHAWNYKAISCADNLRYSDNVTEKFADMPLDVLRGFAVSAFARAACGSNPAAWKR